MEEEGNQEVDTKQLPTTQVQVRSKQTSWRVGSRVFHCFLAILFIAALVLSVVSVVSFLLKHNEIKDKTEYNNDQDGRCILFGEYHDDEFELGPDGPCRYAIYGEGAVALLAGVFVASMIIKAICGCKAIGILPLFELFIVVVVLLNAIAVAVTIALGIMVSCDQFGKQKNESDSCNGYQLTNSSGHNPVYFYDEIVQAEITALLGAAALLLICVVYVILAFAYCIKTKMDRGSRPERESLLGNVNKPDTPKPFDT